MDEDRANRLRDMVDAFTEQLGVAVAKLERASIETMAAPILGSVVRAAVKGDEDALNGLVRMALVLGYGEVEEGVELGEEEGKALDRRISEMSTEAEEHLGACLESCDSDDESIPTYGPFCGCLTCIVREVIGTAMWGKPTRDGGDDDGA